MAHPATRNDTPYAFEQLHLIDEDARPLLVVVIKGTFAIGPDGRCTLAEEQVPVNVAGELNGKDPATASMKYEPEVAFFKPATDVVMNGHAYAPRTGTTEVIVGLRVGPVRKQVRVSGDRAWYRSGGKIAVTRAAVFDKLPLTWERAFGGWDRSQTDPARQSCEPRNPVGIGYRSTAVFEDNVRLPNLEAPDQLMQRFGDRPVPVGFGFVSPHWEPRAALAGTFDEKWRTDRSPLLPSNFDRRHLNAAPADQVVAGYLRGDEQVSITGAAPPPRATLSFNLPGRSPPAVRVAMRNGSEQRPVAALDTVMIEPDEMRVLLWWRAHVTLPSGPHDIKAIEISSEPAVR